MNLHSHKIGISSIHIPVDAMPVKSNSSFNRIVIEYGHRYLRILYAIEFFLSANFTGISSSSAGL
jgi:hypothetical protein